jgi:hypothetical protein
LQNRCTATANRLQAALATLIGMTSTDITTTDIVDRLLSAIRTGSPVTGLYRGDAQLDATVPNWRFTVDGAAAITTEYGRWFAHPGRFSELRRTPTADGEVVEYTLRWIEDGAPHAVHHVHVLAVDGARQQIATDRVWCGGRWDAALLAQMGQADG